MDESEKIPSKKSLLKKWWFWLIIVIVGAALFIPYLRVAAECAPCPEGAVCVPCPEYNQSLVGYIIDLF